MYTALLHLLGGQQYDEYILVQLLFLALIPAGMFALGWRLHSISWFWDGSVGDPEATKCD